MAEPTLTLLFDRLVAERRSGATFAEAWPVAVGKALAGVSGVELNAWQSALSGTRLAWEASYNRWPQRRLERALVAVADDPDRVPVLQGASDCPICGEDVLQGGRGPRRMYCSARCRRDAYERRLAPAA